MNSRQTATVKLYKGIKVDPTYSQLCMVDLKNYTPEITMTAASIVKIGEPIRLNTTGINYFKIFNCNYLQFTDDGLTFNGFITDIKYVNDGTSEVYYDLDYLNTYKSDFKTGSLFVSQTTSLPDNVNPTLDTPTLDHTTPNTRLGAVTQKATDAEIVVYYANTPAKSTINLPKVSYIDGLDPDPGKPGGKPKLAVEGMTVNKTGDKFNENDSYKIGIDQTTGASLSKGIYPDLATMLKDPALWNSDGSSKIIRAELHEKYGADVNASFNLSADELLSAKDPTGNWHNPFYRYVLNIGTTSKEIPSRYMNNFTINVKHRLNNTPGSPDLFIVTPDANQENPDSQSLVLPVLTTPLVLSGTWAKFYKQRNRLETKAQNFVNDLNTKIKNFLLSSGVSLFNNEQSKKLAYLNADVSNKYAKINTANAYAKTTDVIANSYNLDTGAMQYSQGQAKKAIANSLSTSLDNLNRNNETAIKNLQSNQSVELNNLGKTQTLKQSNLAINQATQKTNLDNSFNTDKQKIDLQAIGSFFKDGAGAILSGSLKSALMGVFSAMLTGALNTQTAQDINELSYHGGHGATDPAGAEERLKTVFEAQIKTMDTSQKVEMDNTKSAQAIALANLTRSQATNSYTTQNQVNTTYANKLLDFQTQSNSLKVSNDKATYNAQKDNELAIKNADNAQLQSKENALNSYNNSYNTIANALVVDSKKLYNEITNSINNFNNEIDALLADTGDDVIVLGSNDDRGQIESGMRDVTLTVYYQGDDILDENHRLIKQYGQTVNDQRQLSDLLGSVTGDIDGSSYVYVKGQNVRGMYNIPPTGRAKIVSALERGCKIYTE